MRKVLLTVFLSFLLSVGAFCAEGDTSSFAVPVSPSLFYSVSQALLSSLGLDIQAETSSREILDRYAESQTVPSGIPSSLTFQTWEAANGDISTFLQLRAAEFRAFWGVLSGLLGLSSSEADALYSSGQTVPVAAFSVDLGRDIYIHGQHYFVSTVQGSVSASSSFYSVDYLGTPIFSIADIPSSGYIETTVGLSPKLYTFRLFSNGNVNFYSDNSSGLFVTLKSSSWNAVYYAYDAVNSNLYLGVVTRSYYSELSIDGSDNRFIWNTDIVGSTLVNSAPNGLAIDTPVNNWDTVNDDAGYYLSLGQAGTTADSISDSVISTLSQTGTLTREGTYADSLSDAVGELDTPIDVPTSPDLPQGLPDLGALLITRFPFSIPWDFARVFSLLVAEPEVPEFTVNIYPFLQKWGASVDDTSFHFSLAGDFAIIGAVCRWGSYISFCMALIVLTKRLVWPA